MDKKIFEAELRSVLGIELEPIESETQWELNDWVGNGEMNRAITETYWAERRMLDGDI